VIPEYKTAKENFEEALAEARKMTKKEIEDILRDRVAFHGWAVRAYEQALKEKEDRQ
jgi:CHASE3 domain sensor protein